MPRSAARSGAAVTLRFARIMLIIQVPLAVLLAGIVFWQVGLSQRPHHVAAAALSTAGYIVVVAIGIAAMQWTWRKQARRQARAAGADSAD